MCQVLFSLRVFCFCFFLWTKRRVSSCFSLGAHPHFSFITSTHEKNKHGNAHVGHVLVTALAVPRQEPAAPEPGRAAARPRGRCLLRVRRPVRERLLQPAQLLRGRNGRGDGGGVVRVLAVELLARGQPQLDRVQGRFVLFVSPSKPLSISLTTSFSFFFFCKIGSRARQVCHAEIQVFRHLGEGESCLFLFCFKGEKNSLFTFFFLLTINNN